MGSRATNPAEYLTSQRSWNPNRGARTARSNAVARAVWKNLLTVKPVSFGFIDDREWWVITSRDLHTPPPLAEVRIPFTAYNRNVFTGPSHNQNTTRALR